MSNSEFLIVGLGASAGGIKAFKEFFEHVPADSGMAYVVILHLSPEHDSRLAEVLQVSASIPVTQVRERLHVEPNHVYVVSPNLSLSMLDGYLSVSDMTRIEERRAPVDIFFRTLAEARRSRAACVVLSGTGANGSTGLKRVKELGGICFVQDPDEAEYNDMPRNSIATALVDHVLPVASIPAKIIAYRNSLDSLTTETEDPERPPTDEATLRDLFSQLRIRTGHDFSNYKRATVLRRIQRRMSIHQIRELATYGQYVRERPEEAQALLKDLLISVTNFFRDREAFESLERNIIPKLFVGKSEEDQVRAWIAGCATGEEAYSIAMLLAEHSAGVPGAPAVQVFGTDIDASAIAVAREGIYTINDTADVSPERLRRFFQREGDTYRVRKELREIVLFAHHNIIKDPPFSHLNLLSCRNLLIYLNRSAQQRVMEVMHFALNPGAYLFLGTTESVEGSGDLFAPVEKEAHIYQSRAISARMTIPIPELTVPPANRRTEPESPIETRTRERLSADLHLRLLEQFGPPSVVVNEEHDIVHMSENAGRYLQFAGGEPSLNLLRVARPELRLELRTALYQAAQKRTNVTARNLGLRIDDRNVVANIVVRPVVTPSDTARGFFLVSFEESHKPDDDDAGQAIPTPVNPVDAAHQLEDELVRLKAQLRATVERHETQSEDLKASNEELQAMNEELRSSTEELETSKEELQSMNEELRTVNQELKIKIDEQSQANNDIQNLINSTDIATIFLDRASRIKLFTPRTRDIFSVIPVDRGRALFDISSHLVDSDLAADIDRVLDRLERVEREMQTSDGRWYLMRVLPYRTAEDRIDGVVLTFVDITERRLAEQTLRRWEERIRVVLETVPDYAIITLDSEGRIDRWNSGAAAMFGFDEGEAVGTSLEIIFTPEDRERGAASDELRRAKETGRAMDERWHMHKDGTRLFVSGALSPVRDAGGAIIGYVKIAKDLTERKKWEDQLQRAHDDLDARVRERTGELADANASLDAELRDHREAEERVRKLVKRLVTIQEDERRRVARNLHDHLGQQITAIRLTLESLRPDELGPQADQAVVEAHRITEQLDRELAVFTSELRPPVLDDLGLPAALGQYVAEWSKTSGVATQFQSSGLKSTRLTQDLDTNLYRIAQEALNNAAKHADASRVDVFLGRRGNQVVLIVEDNGRGFQLADSEGDGRDRGFGLLGMRERAALMGGHLEIETRPGTGTSIFVRVPAAFTEGE